MDNPGAPTRNAESSSTIERFRLRGPSAELDPRYHAYRGDLADVALAGRLFAPHYASPAMRRAGDRPAPLRLKPSPDAEIVDQLQPGETFALLDITAEWGWGYRQSDHLVAYVRADALV